MARTTEQLTFWRDRVREALDAWQASLGARRGTIKEFASAVGMSESAVSRYLSMTGGLPTEMTALAMDRMFTDAVSGFAESYFSDARLAARDLGHARPLFRQLARVIEGEPHLSEASRANLAGAAVRDAWSDPAKVPGEWFGDTYIWWATDQFIPADDVHYAAHGNDLTIEAFQDEVASRLPGFDSSALARALEQGDDDLDRKTNRRKVTLDSGAWVLNSLELTRGVALPVRRMTFGLGRAIGPDTGKQQTFRDETAGAITVFLDEPHKVPWPAPFAIHTLAVTSDGWVLLALRNEKVFITKGTWSASFEENAEHGYPPSLTDQTLGETVRRGFPRETSDSLEGSIGGLALVALGRRMSLSDDYLGPIAFAVAQLTATKDEIVTAVLGARGPADDEHDAFGFLRITRERQVYELITECRAGIDAIEGHSLLFGDVEAQVVWLTGKTPRRAAWHPSSLIRLYLWAQFARHIHESPAS